MSGNIEPRFIEGRVITDGVAQDVTREDGVVRVRLTVFGDLAPKLDYEAMAASCGQVSIPFPQPVSVEAGETAVVEIEWRPGPVQEAAFHMGTDATLTRAHTFGGTAAGRALTPPPDFWRSAPG
jgi:hypothetical protein